MINGLIITNLSYDEIESAHQVFQASIPDAFEKEGLGSQKEFINSEILHKKHMLHTALEENDSKLYFKIAKLNNTVIGTVSFGPCGEDTKKCTDNKLSIIGELGSLYVLPDYQGQGVGSALINSMLTQLSREGIEKFCLDSGYKRAQKRWLRKFGEPYKIVKDYWGPGSEHMIWLCKVSDFV